MNNPDEVQPPMKIKRLSQETRIVAVCETDEGVEFDLVLDSNHRPIPVPYTEEP